MKKAFIFLLIICFFSLSSCSRPSDIMEDEFRDIIRDATINYGKNIRIAIIDSGVNSELLPEKNNINFSADSNSFDLIDHGTPIFNIIKNSDIGIAPYSEIFALKVINESGFASMKSIFRALEWCLQNDIDIINISMSYQIYDSNVEALIELLIEQGVVIIASISNETTEIDYPSTYENVIAVGYTQNIDHYNSATSIILKKQYSINSVSNKNVEAAYNGNSAFAPVVTGIVACLLSDDNYSSERGDYIEQLVLDVKEILYLTDLEIMK